jgi:death on curing protein
MSDYLTLVEVLAIHADQIDRYGGSPGIRDQGLLEAALYRPQTGYYADLIEEAAALWESLAQKSSPHRRQQANGICRHLTFLSINGARLTAPADEVYTFIAGLYEGNAFKFDRLVLRLRANVSEIKIAR